MAAEKPKTLLLLEDDALIAMTEQMQLETYGYTTITASNGEEAVNVCLRNPAIDLILMNIELGAGMSGPEAAIQILKTHQLPVVFLSSHSIQEMKAQAELISAYGYVMKGSSHAVLDASIKMAFKHFNSHHGRAETEVDP